MNSVRSFMDTEAFKKLYGRAPTEQERKRRTGRSTRMVKEAVRLAREGRAVYVVVARQSHIASIRDMIAEEVGRDSSDGQLGISVDTSGMLGNFDWESLSLRGAHRNCVVLVDHYAIESKFGSLLDMLTRFDEPQVVGADTAASKVD